MKGTLFLFIMAIGLLILPCTNHALEPHKKVTQYIHDVWDHMQELQQAGIFDLAHSRDGYLWLAAENLVARFNGARFELFNLDNITQSVNSEISCFLADRQSGLWIGTKSSGLIHRKNGVFTTLTTKDGLPGNEVSACIQDRNGRLWIGTDKGLCSIEKQTVTTYTRHKGLEKSINAIYEDKYGSIWFEAGGRKLFCLKNGKFTSYPLKGFPGTSNNTSFYEDLEGGLWLKSLSSSYSTLPQLRRFKDGKITNHSAGGNLSEVLITSMLEDGNLGMLFGTYGSGIIAMKNGSFQSFTSKEGLSNDRVTDIFRDSRGTIWIGTYKGLNQLKDGKIIPCLFKGKPLQEWIYTIFEDRQGSLWITTDQSIHRLRDGPLTKYSTAEGLSSNRVSVIIEDKQRRIWAGTADKGLNCLYRDSFASLTMKDGLLSNEITTLCQQKNGDLWIGTSKGLNLLKGGKISICKNSVNRVEKINALFQDRQGTLWIGTQRGLNRLVDDKITPYDDHKGVLQKPILTINHDHKGNLLVGTWLDGLFCLTHEGVSRFDTARGLSQNSVKAIHADKEGNIWIGTAKGLNRLKNGIIHSVFLENGLLHNDIYHIVGDDHQSLWISCPKGIFQIEKQQLYDFWDGKRKRVTPISYAAQDGLTSVWESRGGCKSSSGKIWFGINQGMAVLDPRSINGEPLPVNIGSVSVDGQIIPVNYTHDLKIEALSFSPGKGHFQVRYSAVSLVSPERVQFKYKMEPIDQQWFEAGYQNSAIYTNLAPGNYTFRVKACNNLGVWNPSDTAIPFHLEAWFYQSRWFYLFCILAVAATAFFAYRYRIGHLKQREKELAKLVEKRTKDLQLQNIKLENAHHSIESKNTLLEEQSQKLKELDNAKSQFFTNISHQFRTPLTLITGPLEEMIDACGDQESEKKRKMNLVLRNAQRLRRLIDQLLELSKLDSGKMKLQLTPTAIHSFLKGITASFQLLARQKELDLRFQPLQQPRDSDLVIHIDARKMEDVLTNLLSNALKFTPAGGRITVGLKSGQEGKKKTGLEISISDTGPGIPVGKTSQIFDRFFQADSTSRYHHKGSGIGLALCKELVALHGGTIEARSPKGMGSQFIIRLPGVPVEYKGVPVEHKPSSHQPDYLSQLDIKDGIQSPDTQQDSQPETDPATDAKKTIILVVEDNADLRQYIRETLEAEYTVVSASNGVEGVQKAQETIPDLVISDVMMPGMDGYELCRQLKKDVNTSHIPIVLLTAKSSEASIVKGLETGADDYITKPFSTSILTARIKNLIDIRNQLQMNIKRVMTLQPVKTKMSRIDREFIQQLHKVIDENLSDEDFNVEQLGKKLYMSRASLYRKVQALSSLTPNEFIRGQRLKRGAELLEQNFGSVLDVSLEVGFGNPSYFAKCFKEKFHTLPSEYSRGAAPPENV